MRRVGVMAVLLSGLVLGACGGGDDGGSLETDVPQGFKLLKGPDYALAYPAAFKALPERKSENGSSRSFVGADGASGFPPQVAIGRTPEDSGAFKLALEAFKADNRVRRWEWKILSERSVKIEGAQHARMFEASYNEKGDDGPQPIRTIDLLVRSKGGTQFDILLRAPEADFDRAGLRKIIDTLKVR